MSDERRRYLLRQRLIALPGGSARTGAPDLDPDGLSDTLDGGGGQRPRGPVPLRIVRDWDEDARRNAYTQAEDAAALDPDAADFLLDCLRADPASGSESDASDGDSVNGEVGIYGSDGDDDALFGDPSPSGKRGGASRPKPFDPMRMLARVARYYRWSHLDIMRLPWRTFLGYVREADVMTQEEKADMDREMARGRSRYGSPAAAAGGRWE